jgi:hypothetical protein
MYVNGAQITQFDSESYPGQNQVPLGANGNYAVGIGRLTTTYTHYFDGYMAEYHYVDGTAHDPTAFGEYDDNGVWRPIKVTGITYGNRGWYLPFDPTATNGIGHDHSGNGNNFTPSGFVTSGTGTDVMFDTPTNNFPTANPLYPDVDMNPTYSNGNLRVTTQGFSTVLPTSGKWFWELTSITNYGSVGLIKNSVGGTSSSFYSELRTYYDSGIKYNGSVSGYGVSWTTGDVIGVAVDMDAGTISMYKNGSSQGTMFSDITSSTSPSGWRIFLQQVECNFGQRAFSYSVPSGYSTLNTANLPAPDIADGSQYFNTVLWTGNGSSSSRTISGVGFQPDFTWIKGRSYNGSGNRLMDAVRGAGQMIQTNSINAEFDDSANVPSFASDGFTLTTTGTSYNASGQTYVAWNWLAGGSGSSNTDGSITSTVSVNPTAGFSIVSWTASGTNNDTVGHGLGVVPDFMILKSRDGARNWLAYTQKIDGSLDFLRLNTGDTKTDSSANVPTSTTFSVIGSDVNPPGEDIVAYCFAEVEGYSKFGTFTGNGNADGPFIHLGFKPSWLVIKNTTTAQGWYLNDSARNPYNLNYLALFPANSGAESASTGGAAYDFLSNGFKPRTGNNDSNGSGDTYVFMAFAEHPFGGDGVSPATAR